MIMSEEMKQQFVEAFIKEFKVHPAEYANGSADQSAAMGFAIWAWKASRADLVVELPGVGVSWPDDTDEGVKYREEYRDDVKAILESAGVQVKP